VARNADVTFSDIKLVVDGKEVTTGGGSNPIPDTTNPADPNSTRDRELRQYALEGYAAARGVTGGGLLLETSNRYWKVSTAQEFLKAVAEAKSSGKASVIELTDDIALGSKEIGAALTQYGSIIKPAANQPLLHPTLIQTGVSTLQLSGMSNLTIFSKNGAKLTHVTIDIRNSSNIILRNLVFDELWEWDEATHGDYDRNDWDYITIQDGSTGIWIDHSTFYKAYDGIVDVKKAASDNTSDVTISWSTFLPASQGSFFHDMMELLEANPGQYPFYQELLTTHAMSKEQIRQYSAAQKKTHLIGASDTEANTSNLRITLANNYYKNSMDRMPRVRQGSAHVYNTIMDATELYDLRNSLTDEYASSKVVSNGAISTQGASVLVENSSISGIVKALLSGNGSSSAGYIGALNSVYVMNGVETGLTVTDSTYSGLVMDVDGFKNALPYSYQVYDARSLASQVLPYAGAGAVSMSSVQWQKAVYNNLSGEDVQGPVWLPGSLTASRVTPTGLTLTWPAAADNVGVTGYKVYTVTGSTYSEHVSLGSVTTYNLTGLSQDTEYTFAVKAVDAAGNLSADALYVTVRTGREIQDNNPDPVDTPDGTPVGNGTQPGEGLDSAVKEESKDGVVTAVIDAARVTGLLAKMDPDENVFTITIKTKGDVVQTKFSSDVLDALSNKNSEAIFQIKSDIGTYRLPAKLIDASAFAKQWGVSEKDLEITVKMEKIQGVMAEGVNHAAATLGAKVLSAPVEFSVSIRANNGRTQEIHSFGTYVERSFTLPKAVNPQTAAGVLYNPQTQTFAPVPTVFNGLEAKILRPGNSIYTVLENSRTFTDLAGHWAKTDVEILASKLIVNGMSASQYAPDQFITRAEFAALLVRALGLDEVEASGFSDVADTDWFSGAVGAAQKAKLIDGFEDGSFRPNATISREQMAAMIVRAMSLGGKEIQADVQVLGKFADRSSISGWSKAAAAQALTAGIIQGTTDSAFAPQENATRAQAAVLLKRTLQALKFIN
jgi:pectate lyase